LGIYLELFEILEYLKDLYQVAKPSEVTYIPPLTRFAWETACTQGFIQPDNKFHYKLRHIYEATHNFNYLMNQAIDTRVKSTLSLNDKVTLTNGLVGLLSNMAKSLVPMLLEVKAELEKQLGLSAQEIERHQDAIRKRMQELRIAPASGVAHSKPS
jgi:hypothetical protein